MDNNSENILLNLVRIGTVSSVDSSDRKVRVIFKDKGIVSGWLYVLQHHSADVNVENAGDHDHEVSLGGATSTAGDHNHDVSLGGTTSTDGDHQHEVSLERNGIDEWVSISMTHR